MVTTSRPIAGAPGRTDSIDHCKAVFGPRQFGRAGVAGFLTRSRGLTWWIPCGGKLMGLPFSHLVAARVIIHPFPVARLSAPSSPAWTPRIYAQTASARWGRQSQRHLPDRVPVIPLALLCGAKPFFGSTLTDQARVFGTRCGSSDAARSGQRRCVPAAAKHALDNAPCETNRIRSMTRACRKCV